MLHFFANIACTNIRGSTVPETGGYHISGQVTFYPTYFNSTHHTTMDQAAQTAQELLDALHHIKKKPGQIASRHGESLKKIATIFQEVVEKVDMKNDQTTTSTHLTGPAQLKIAHKTHPKRT